MVDFIDLNEAKEIYNIDIGGTPANVLEKGKINFLLEEGIKPEQIVVVVDPFDLSRIERSLVLSDVGTVKRLKFPIETLQKTENWSSEYVNPPKKEQVKQLFDSNQGKILDTLHSKYQIFKPDKKKQLILRYNELREKISEASSTSKNLRVFMNSLIEILSSTPIKLKYLESILSENQEKIYDILKQTDIEARVFCPECGKITPYTFNARKLEDKICCSNVDNIIKKGAFVPEEGMLPTILYICGITPCVGVDSSYGIKAIGILKKLEKFDRPFIMYSKKPDKTMFEEFNLREK